MHAKYDKHNNTVKKIKAFYNELPFNMDSIEKRARRIRANNQIELYGSLDTLLKQSAHKYRVLDVGCGVGWFLNTVAYHYTHHVVGVDISENAICIAEKIAQNLTVDHLVKFYNRDLCAFQSDVQFDFINALGVLHHMPDIELAIKSIASFVKSDGYLHVGLYHTYGRRPFYEYFADARNAFYEKGMYDAPLVQDAFKKYVRLNDAIGDKEFLWSWFRDQVLHPFEMKYTFKEVYMLLLQHGFTVCETSINKYQKINDFKALFFEEEQLYRYAQERLNKEEFYPGFFTVLAKKSSGYKL